jgi:CRISPR/Cas system type I-B associated protein Csh2 (Cas7 group RAMP superfamily)
MLSIARAGHLAIQIGSTTPKVPVRSFQTQTCRPKKKKVEKLRRKPPVPYGINSEDGSIVLPREITGYTDEDIQKLHKYVHDR